MNRLDHNDTLFFLLFYAGIKATSISKINFIRENKSYQLTCVLLSKIVKSVSK